MAVTTIFVRGHFYENYDEARASVAIKPGYLIEKDSDLKVKPHATRGGKCKRTFAIEDCLQGTTVGSTRTGMPTDTYAIGELVRYCNAMQGDRLNAVLKVGESVTKGDMLISYGDGTLCKAASSYLAVTTADSTTITNTTVETTASNGTATIKKNSLRAGDSIRIRAFWVFVATNSTDTAVLKLKIGSTAILTTAAVDVADNDIGVLEATLFVRDVGATGHVVGFGTWSLGVPGTATTRSGTLASTAIDTTGDLTISTTITMSVANTGNQAVLREFVVEHIKSGTNAGTGVAGGEIVAQAEETKDLSLASADDFCLVSVV